MSGSEQSDVRAGWPVRAGSGRRAERGAGLANNKDQLSQERDKSKGKNDGFLIFPDVAEAHYIGCHR